MRKLRLNTKATDRKLKIGSLWPCVLVLLRFCPVSSRIRAAVFRGHRALCVSWCVSFVRYAGIVLASMLSLLHTNGCGGAATLSGVQQRLRWQLLNEIIDGVGVDLMNKMFLKLKLSIVAANAAILS